MRFLTKPQARERFVGRTVAIVGSGPGSLDNPPGLVDSHEIVVRINNYKLRAATGLRCDVFYSFFGTSIRKTVDDLKRDGVTLCLCKCPDAQFMESDWHRRNGKMAGVDFCSIYRSRKSFWFCDTYVPGVDEFLATFHLLGARVPTTGFAAILDVLSFDPKSVYLTGFDFFRSGRHNVDEPWRAKNTDDPIGHVPEREMAWLSANAARHPIALDPALTQAMKAGSGFKA